MPNDDLTILKQQRGQIKAKITRLKKFFENLDIQNLNETDFLDLENRFQRFEPLLDDFEKIQDSIENLSTDFNSEEILREEFEDMYHLLHAQIKGAISSYKVSLHNNAISSQTNNVNLNTSNSQLRLPSLKLPTFHGNYTEWIEFRDAFTSMIDDNNSMSNIDKFYYLRSSLGGEASKVIESLKPSNSNYNVAWQLLLERFENTRLIIYNHVSAIFNQRSVREESHTDLRKLLDNTTANLRNLKILGEPTEYWDSLIIHILSTKFDKVTMREWDAYKIAGDRPTIKDLNNFLSERCRFLEKVALTQHSSKDKYQSKFKQRNLQSATFLSTTNQVLCYYCKKAHTIYNCNDFLKLSQLEKETEVKQRELCLNCLKPNHKVEYCKMSSCKKCGKRHNTLLHNEKFKAKEKREEENIDNSGNEISLPITVGDENKSRSCNVASSQSRVALLATAVVYIKHSDGFFDKCRVLLDNGAQNSFITERLCKKLKLHLRPIDFSIIGVGKLKTNVNYSTMIDLHSCNSSFSKTISCLVLPEITGDLPTSSFSKDNIKIPNNLIPTLADPNFNEKGSIDVLLGADIFWEILDTEKITLDCGLILYNTRLGYIISGNLSVSRNEMGSVNNNSINCTQISRYQTLEDNLIRFWQIEEINPAKNYLSDSELLCEKHFVENYTRDDKGNFIVSIPFKSNYEKLLGNSKELALKRFHALEKRLLKDSDLYEEYKNVMLEYETLGHMSKVKDEDILRPGFYLPHHAVVKTSLTTKVRVVFDASMKSDSNYSLNDVQYAGPVIQSDLFSIILRFRKYRYALTGDISKMYRMIHIHKNDQRFHRLF